MSDNLAEVMQSALADTFEQSKDLFTETNEAAAAEAKAAEEQPRGDDGKFASRKRPDPTQTDEENAAEAKAEEEQEAKASEEDKPVELPEGMVKVAVIPSEGLPFKVMDSEGELEVPAIKVQYTANGKERTDDLPQLVKMAQWGAYNQEKEARFQRTAEQASAIADENNRLQAALEQREAELEWVLKADENYLTAREKWEAENTPEAALRKKEAQLQERQEHMELEQIAQQGQRLFQEELAPALERISQALPYVTSDELGAKLLMAIEPYRVSTRRGSIVPPRSYEAVRQMVLNEVLPWAKELHEQRTARFGAATAGAEKKVQDAVAEVTKAKIETQKTRNLAARTLKPSGRTQRETPQSKPIVSVQDGMDSAIADTMAAVLGSR